MFVKTQMYVNRSYYKSALVNIHITALRICSKYYLNRLRS